jgi:NADH-quinone oxidoreductase subunit F
MTCLEGEGKMLAHDWEVRDCREEGIDVMPGRNFLEITNKDRKVTGVRTVNVDFRGFVDGKLDLDVIPGTETVIPCDVVIYAISQRPDLALLTDKVETARGKVVVDKNSLATNVPGIFAGGDAVTGTTWVVEAVDAGHKAARAIEMYLKDETAGTWPPAVQVLERLPEAKMDEDQKRNERNLSTSRFSPDRNAAERRAISKEVKRR